MGQDITKEALKPIGFKPAIDGNSLVWLKSIGLYTVQVFFMAHNTYVRVEDTEKTEYIGFDSCESIEELELLCKMLEPK